MGKGMLHGLYVVFSVGTKSSVETQMAGFSLGWWVLTFGWVTQTPGVARQTQSLKFGSVCFYYFSVVVSNRHFWERCCVVCWSCAYDVNEHWANALQKSEVRNDERNVLCLPGLALLTVCWTARGYKHKRIHRWRPTLNSVERFSSGLGRSVEQSKLETTPLTICKY